MHKGLSHRNKIPKVLVLVELTLFGNRHTNISITSLVLARIRRMRNQGSVLENDGGGDTAVFEGVLGWTSPFG